MQTLIETLIDLATIPVGYRLAVFYGWAFGITLVGLIVLR